MGEGIGGKESETGDIDNASEEFRYKGKGRYEAVESKEVCFHLSPKDGRNNSIFINW